MRVSDGGPFCRAGRKVGAASVPRLTGLRRLGARLAMLLTAPVVPLTVLFAATAWPARLYAESGTDAGPPPTCAAIHDPACDGKDGGNACQTNGSAGVCNGPFLCLDDAGDAAGAYRCEVPPAECGSPEEYLACEGKVWGDPCGTGLVCRLSCSDGGGSFQLVCSLLYPEAGPPAPEAGPPPADGASSVDATSADANDASNAAPAAPAAGASSGGGGCAVSADETSSAALAYGLGALCVCAALARRRATRAGRIGARL